jgi:NhaP-type Na+/H+ or K+/H+ antiporter
VISATDPVAVIAIFGTLGADEDLYINVFGEAVLNDAVAFVIYETVKGLVKSGAAVSGKEVMTAIGIFVGIFVGSALLGAIIAFLAAAVYKTGYFNPMLPTDQGDKKADDSRAELDEASPPYLPQPMAAHGALVRTSIVAAAEPFHLTEATDHVHEESAIYETVIVIVTGLCAYMLAAALGLSGITAVVVAGMIMSCYVAPNLSPVSQEWVRIVSMGEHEPLFPPMLLQC